MKKRFTIFFVLIMTLILVGCKDTASADTDFMSAMIDDEKVTLTLETAFVNESKEVIAEFKKESFLGDEYRIRLEFMQYYREGEKYSTIYNDDNIYISCRKNGDFYSAFYRPEDILIAGRMYSRESMGMDTSKGQLTITITDIEHGRDTTYSGTFSARVENDDTGETMYVESGEFSFSVDS